MEAHQQSLLLLTILTGHQLFAGGSFSGVVVGWGDNTSGQATGTPTQNLPSAPSSSTGLVRVAGQVLSNVVAIAAGANHGLALTVDGTVVGWGYNISGQATGVKTPYPYNTNGLVVVGGEVLSNVTAIAAGLAHSLALKRDGTVAEWGEGEHSSAKMNVPPGLSNVVAIAAGWRYNLAVKRDGTVTGWGAVSTPGGLSNIVAVATGGGYYAPSLALRNNGTVVQWGPGGFTESVPAAASNVVAIAAGEGHCLTLRSNGTVVEWRNESAGATEPVGLTNVVAVAAGAEGASLALKRDGTVVAWGGLRRPATVPAGLSNVAAIAAGQNFCLAITTNAAPFAPKR